MRCVRGGGSGRGYECGCGFAGVVAAVVVVVVAADVACLGVVGTVVGAGAGAGAGAWCWCWWHAFLCLTCGCLSLLFWSALSFRIYVNLC